MAGINAKAVQATDREAQFGLSLIVAGWLAAFGGEALEPKKA